MIGLLRWGALGRFRIEQQKIALDEVPLYEVALSSKGKLLPYRLHRAGELFRGERVSRLLTPVDFSHWDILGQWGLRPYDPLATLQGLGDLLVLHRLEKEGVNLATSTILLCGDAITPSFQAVALALCPWVRDLVILAPQGGEGLRQRLYQDYGISPRGSCDSATAVVSFTKIPLDKRQRILQLDQVSSPDFCGLQLKNRTIPTDIPPLSWLCLLLQTGKITREDIEIT